jgi:hypothetical protein
MDANITETPVNLIDNAPTKKQSILKKVISEPDEPDEILNSENIPSELSKKNKIDLSIPSHAQRNCLFKLCYNICSHDFF